MSFKTFLVSTTLLVLVSGAAHAQSLGNNAQLGSNIAGPCGNALSNSSDNNRANQNCNTASGGAGGAGGNSVSTSSGGAGGAGGNATGGTASANTGDSTSSANTGASTASVNGGVGNGNVTISNRQRRQAPAVVAPPVYTGNTCLGGFSAGISAPGFGLSGGGTTMDRDCTTREDALMLASLGQDQAAMARLCLGGAEMRRSVEFSGFDCSVVDPKPDYKGGALSRETACHEADNNPDLYLASRGFCP